MSWAARISTEESLRRSLIPVFDDWLLNDSVAASDWVVSELEPGPARDAAAAHVATFLTKLGDYEDSSRWIPMANEQARHQIASDLMRHWCRHNLDEAVLWANSYENADTRRQLLSIAASQSPSER